MMPLVCSCGAEVIPGPLFTDSDRAALIQPLIDSGVVVFDRAAKVYKLK